jgi:hypothetical protein
MTPPRVFSSVRALIAVLAIALALAVAPPASAAVRQETGPAECQPLSIEKSGRLQITVYVGPCSWVNGLGLGVPNGLEIYVTGPSGYRKNLPISVAVEYTYAVTPMSINVPRFGTYTLVVHTWDGIVPGCYEAECFTYDGVSKRSAILKAPSPTPTPRPSPRPTAIPTKQPSTTTSVPTLGPSAALPSDMATQVTGHPPSVVFVAPSASAQAGAEAGDTSSPPGGPSAALIISGFVLAASLLAFATFELMSRRAGRKG